MELTANEGRVHSGCKAMQGCANAIICHRHHKFKLNPHVGFHAHQLCRVNWRGESHYPFLLDTTHAVNHRD